VWWEGAALINNVMIALAQCMHGTAVVFAIPPLGGLEVTWPIGLAGLVGVYFLMALVGFWLHIRRNVQNDDDASP